MAELNFESTTDLLKFDKTLVCEILKTYNRKPSDLQVDIDVMKKWLQEQPHLPYCPSDKYIITFLILNKFSIEKTKAKLDMSMTIKSLIPEFFQGLYPSTPEIRRTFRNMKLGPVDAHFTRRINHFENLEDYNKGYSLCFIPLPKMSEEMYRITYVLIKPMENANLSMPFAVLVILLEMLVLLDYSNGHEWILDCSEFTFDLMKRVNPIDMKRGANILEHVYSNRMKAIRFVNLPPYAEWLLVLFKKFLKPKMRNRIYTHSSRDELLELYAKDILPVDLGGTERSIAELKEGWQKLLDDHEDYFKETRTVFIDESKRPEKLINDDILGFHGNFKKLIVD